MLSAKQESYRYHFLKSFVGLDKRNEPQVHRLRSGRSNHYTIASVNDKYNLETETLKKQNKNLENKDNISRDVAAAPQTPQLGGGPRPTLGAQVSLKLLFGYVTIFSSADLFTTDLNCRKKLACDIISECNVILSRRI